MLDLHVGGLDFHDRESYSVGFCYSNKKMFTNKI